MPTPKLLETLADIAYAAGIRQYYSGNSREDMAEFISWAKEFEAIHKNTKWDDKNYMLEIEKFAEDKLNQLS